MAVIDLGKPDNNPVDYQEIEIENISIFVPIKRTETSLGIEISVSKLFAWKKLMVEKY